MRVQRVLESTSSVVRLELSDGIGCSTDGEFEADVLPLLSKDLQSFIAVNAGFTSRSVSALVERCGRTLQQVRFIDCRRLDVDAVKAVGRRCPRLRSVAFVYRGDDGGDSTRRCEEDSSEWWSLSDSQVVAALVNVAGAAELSSVSFVGFQSVCDIEVTYLADCYCSTLRRVDLSNCRSLTDAALGALAERCLNRLRELAFAATRVTDAGVAALVAGCPRLQRIDLTDCSALTDAAAQSLASCCSRLERVSLRRCHRLTSAALDALVRHCPQIQTLDLSETSVDVVTPLVLGLHRLHQLILDGCTSLVSPPPDVASAGIAAIRDYYIEYNPSCRYFRLPCDIRNRSREIIQRSALNEKHETFLCRILSAFCASKLSKPFHYFSSHLRGGGGGAG